MRCHNKILIVIAFLLSYSAYGQSLSVFDVDASDFPTIKAKFYAFDKDGKQLINISESEFLIKENDVERAVTSVSCPVPAPPVAISSLLTIDVSGSMVEGAPNIDLAKIAANAWVNAMPLGLSECAITSFDSRSYINRDFSQDRTRLLSDISKLTPGGGTDYNVAFLDTYSGSFNIAKTGKHKKVIVFLTDGMPNTTTDEASIIEQAYDANIIVNY